MTMGMVSSQLLASSHIAAMDLGDLTSVSFTTLNEISEVQTFGPSSLVRTKITEQLLQTQAKVLVSKQIQISLDNQLLSAETMRQRLGLGSSNIANHPVVLRISALTTTKHLLKRYQLVLLRDMMRMKHVLGHNVRRQMWESWYQNEANIQRKAPNVHNLFLYSLDMSDNDTNDELLHFNKFTLWRPNE